jgi:hypothetical protein
MKSWKKNLPWATNTLACFAAATVTKKKSITTLTPGGESHFGLKIFVYYSGKLTLQP